MSINVPIDIVIQTKPVDVVIKTTPIDVIVSQMGIQGTRGQPGAASTITGAVVDINTLAGTIILTGAGSNVITSNGQIITISGSAVPVSGPFYPIDNPNQFIQSGQVINVYYPLTNPSGYITGFNSGVYYLNSNPNHFINSGDLESTGTLLQNQVYGLSGQFNITGANLQSSINLLSGNLSSTGSYLYSLVNASSAGVSSINVLSGALNIVGAGNIQIGGIGQTITITGNTGFLIGYVPIEKLYTSGAFPTSYKEIWISPRTDGIVGDGTIYNPFDGSSSSKLTGIFANYIDIPTTIHFTAGKYSLVPGNQGDYIVWTYGYNWKILGAGIDKTIIVQTGLGLCPGTGDGRYALFQSQSSTQSSPAWDTASFEISDLTLDNGPYITGVMPSLITSMTPNSIARRVKIINWGSTLINGESFPIFFGNWNNKKVYNCLIENCIAINPWTGNVGGCSIFSCGVSNAGASIATGIQNPFSPVGNADTSNIIRGCYVDCGTGNFLPFYSGVGSGSFPYTHAYFAPVVENNFARNVEKGVYHDTSTYQNVVIRNNQLIDVAHGIEIEVNDPGVFLFDSVIIENNEITLPSFSGVPGLYQDYFGIISQGGYNISNLKIEDNKITYGSGVPASGMRYHGLYWNGGAVNTVIRNNILADFDRAPTNIGSQSPIEITYPYGPTNVVCHNNYRTGLQLLPEINGPYLTGFNSGIYITGNTNNFYLVSNPEHYLKSGEASNISTSGFITTGQIIKYNCFLTSGIETELINYPFVLNTKPTTINCEFENNMDNYIYSLSISGIGTQGFYTNYSDILSTSGYKLQINVMI